MTRVLFVGQTPETIDYSDPALPSGLNAAKIQAGIDVAAAKIAERGWVGDICNIPPDDDGIATLEKQPASATLLMFEKVANSIHKAAPGSAIAFNTRPEDTAEAADRWV